MDDSLTNHGPPDVFVRDAVSDDSAGMAGVEANATRLAYRAIVRGSRLDRAEDSAAAWERMIADPPWDCAAFVAERAGTVIGFVACGRSAGWTDYDGVISALHVHPDHHGQGVGGQLLERAMRWLADRGADSAYVEVYRDNPFRRFYESRGASLVAEFGVSAYGRTVPAVVYGWRGIADRRAA